MSITVLPVVFELTVFDAVVLLTVFDEELTVFDELLTVLLVVVLVTVSVELAGAVKLPNKTATSKPRFSIRTRLFP